MIIKLMMSILEFPLDIIYYISLFIDNNDMYAYTESSTTFNSVCRLYPDLKKKIQRPKAFYLVKYPNLLNWSISHKEYKLTRNLSHSAALQDNTMILKYLYKIGCPFGEIIWQCAIRNNNIKMVKWLTRKQLIPFNTLILMIAVDSNTINIFKFLYEYCEKMDLNAQQDSIFDHAITRGRVEIVDWLYYEKEYQFDRFSFEFAAQSGKIRMLEYIYKLAYNDCSNIAWWTQNVCVSAAEEGHTHVLKWLKERYCPWNIFTTYAAAEYHHIETLKWCIDNKCPVERGLFNCLEEHYGLVYREDEINIFDL